MELGIFQENKVTDGIYTSSSAGYSVVATDAPSRHRSGVVVFYRPAPHFAVEAVQQFRSNAVGFQMSTGGWRWYIVGSYLSPDNTSTIESVIASLKERPRGAKLLVAGDFNVKLSEPGGYLRGEDISEALATE